MTVKYSKDYFESPMNLTRSFFCVDAKFVTNSTIEIVFVSNKSYEAVTIFFNMIFFSEYPKIVCIKSRK